MMRLSCTLHRRGGFRRYYSSDTWNPQLYNQFLKERQQPFVDLLNLVTRRPKLQIVDLGCGPGETDLLIQSEFPDSTILGLDSSPAMIKAAKKYQKSPHLVFEEQNITDFVKDPRSFDVILSNSALHWIPDHPTLIPTLLQRLNPGGQFLFQVPTNHHQEFYVLMREIAQSPPFQEPLKGWTLRWPVLEIDEYAKMFYGLHLTDIVVFEKVYPHVLSDVDAVVSWIQGTGIQAYTSRLPEHLKKEFIEELKKRAAAIHPTGPIFFPFRRLFASAKKQ
eukprot:TRINITY_DN5319_c0_g1_i1.p1 TRINITY_DN5319_c0_g1~~TRINITY_DN5319_c0_g1_i1.p1  ORF type:complete len:277 (+),score=79.80 TRINITY_DN5319_c0_g1_i1:72-902(+)